MWITMDVIKQVDKVARIRYITRSECELWNAHRRNGELRMLTGWEWIARDLSGRHGHGYKTMTVAYVQAFYTLVKGEQAPQIAISKTALKARNRPEPKKPDEIPVPASKPKEAVNG